MNKVEDFINATKLNDLLNKKEDLINMTKLNDIIQKKEAEEEKTLQDGSMDTGNRRSRCSSSSKQHMAVYRFFAPDYLEDFEDDFEDDF